MNNVEFLGGRDNQIRTTKGYKSGAAQRITSIQDKLQQAIYNLQTSGLTKSQREMYDVQLAGVGGNIDREEVNKVDIEFDMPPMETQYQTDLIDMFEYKESHVKKKEFDRQQATYVFEKLKDTLSTVGKGIKPKKDN